MKVPIKAKAAAEMLFEVIYSLTPTIYNEWKVDDIIRLQVRARAIVYYRLCPITIISVSESDTLKELMKKMIENKLWTGDDFFVEVFNVLVSFNIVSLDDLENEFIELCPNIDDFEKYLEILIKPVFLKLPNYKKSIDVCVKYITQQEVKGKITKDESKILSRNVYVISDLVDRSFNSICEVYNQVLQQKRVLQPSSLQFCNKESSIFKNLTSNEKVTFHSGETEHNLTIIFNRLKDGKYLDTYSDLQTWLYVCGDITKQGTNSLNWINQQQLLAYLVDTLFGDTDGQRLWNITQQVFTVKGNPPNIGAMKNTVSKIRKGWKNRPTGFDDLDLVLRL